MTHAQRYLAVVLVLLAMAAAACSGGSGSSGFDALTEDAAIAQALGEQRCVDRQGLRICPADTPLGGTPPAEPTRTPTVREPERTPTDGVPTATPTRTTTRAAVMSPTSTPTPTASPMQPEIRIDTGLTDSNSLPCTPGGGAGCRFTLAFAPSGLPPTAHYRVAVRVAGSRVWLIGADLAPLGPPAMPSFDAPVDVQAVPAAPSQAISAQVAVLVFLEPPTSVPDGVEELADSGAAYAFVSREFTLVPFGPTTQ
jgi:hypothetical protein